MNVQKGSQRGFEGLKKKYAILRGDFPGEEETYRGRKIKGIYVRSDYEILIEAISTVAGGQYTVFNEIYDTYKSLEEGTDFERLLEAVKMNDTLPYSLVIEEFESSKKSHDKTYMEKGIIRGESGIPDCAVKFGGMHGKTRTGGTYCPELRLQVNIPQENGKLMIMARNENCGDLVEIGKETAIWLRDQLDSFIPMIERFEYEGQYKGE